MCLKTQPHIYKRENENSESMWKDRRERYQKNIRNIKFVKTQTHKLQ